MTLISQPDSPPITTTTTNQDLPIDFLDIVATQGIYLVPRAGTPVLCPEAYDGQFAATLERHLNALLTVQTYRRAMYHGVADEWPIGRTPPEVKEERKAELKALDELEGVTSDDDGGDNDDGDKNKDKDAKGKGKGGNGGIDVARVGPGKPVTAPDWLPTPPPSAESPPLATPHKRKRRRISGEDDDDDDEKKERPAKKHTSPPIQEASDATEDAVTNPNIAQQKSRKRRRTYSRCG
ncbi:hypothetical protein F5Y12DRAFT_774602 [Xylaria sp. FL1777]|nr:hypothetical protein F5Y12DRAFT_774602 [Xylaria sp. FL1777]